jgi:DNA-directed RNA polymerase subunit M/transcription elongation factor TFIIS
MFCRQCGSFLETKPVAGEATRICHLCNLQQKDPELRIIKSYYGQASSATTMAVGDEQLQMEIDDIIDDATVFQPPGCYCPTCSGQLKAAMQPNQRYIFVCSTCKKIVPYH